MILGRGKSHPGELELRTLPDLTPDAFELARFWVNSERSFVSVGFHEKWKPELLGSLIVECLQTAAVAYAAGGSMTEADALERLWRGADEERVRLSTQERPEGSL